MRGKAIVPAIRFAGFTDAWEQRKVKDICVIGTGKSNTQDQIEDGEYPFFIRSDVPVRSDKYLYDCEAVITIGDGNIGKVFHYVDGKFDLHQRCYKMTDFQNIWGKYFFHFFSTKFYDRAMKMTAKATVDSVRLEMISEMDIQKPPQIDEQKKIAAFFDSLDHLITLHQRKYSRLCSIKKSMLERMFPKEGASVPEIRFAGFTDAWEQRKLGKIVREVTRNDPTSSAPIMMITANNGFIEQSERYAFNNAGESLKRYILLEKGELAYNHGASKLRPYGSCFSLTTAENARIPFVYHCFSAEGQNPEFMSIELNGADIENQLRQIVSSGARMDGLLNISFEEYTSISVLLPSIAEQNRIADFFCHLDHLITLHQRKLERLQNIKKSCLEKMFV